MTDQDHPRDNLFRGVSSFEFSRSQEEDKTGDGHMVGHFAVFDQWTEIDSTWEGRFLERIAPGAFKKTIKENRDSVRVLFQHGHDPHIGDKALGVIESLAEDDQGAAYDVRLFDTSYNRDLIPGLEAGQYGASFRMQVTREDWVTEPKQSDLNPRALPERTIKEIRLYEFGPVTFPAYQGADAGIRGCRSLTDDMIITSFRKNPERVKQLLGFDLPAVITNSSGGTTTTFTTGTATNGNSFVINTNPTIAPAENAGQEPTFDARRSTTLVFTRSRDEHGNLIKRPLIRPESE